MGGRQRIWRISHRPATGLPAYGRDGGQAGSTGHLERFAQWPIGLEDKWTSKLVLCFSSPTRYLCCRIGSPLKGDFYGDPPALQNFNVEQLEIKYLEDSVD